MTLLLEMFTYPFIVRAFAAGVLLSLCAALLGVPLVLKRYSMIGDGLSHVSFGGAVRGAGLRLGAAAGVHPGGHRGGAGAAANDGARRMRADAAIAVVSASSLAVGVIVTSLTTGMTTDVDSYMFGSILAMTQADVVLSALLCVGGAGAVRAVLPPALLPSPLTRTFPVPPGEGGAIQHPAVGADGP